MNFNKGIACALTALTGLALFIGGCGGSGYGDAEEPTSTTAAPVSRATDAPPTSAPAGRATESPPALTPSVTAAPSTELTLAASSLRFEQTSLTAPAGNVTIVFDNRDEGIPHNLHVFKGSDASGEEVGATEIEAGAIRQTLALGELAAGTYFYRCDVHPSQMMGTLTIT